MKRLESVFRPESKYRPFFLSVMTFSLAYSLYKGVIDNYLAEIVGMSGFDKGVSEFFRELPGLLLVFILAALYTFSAEKIYRLGALFMLAGMAAQAVVSPGCALVILCIFVYSLGDHMQLGMRNTLSLQYAREGRGGEALGLKNAAQQIGTLAGFLVIIGTFALVKASTGLYRTVSMKFIKQNWVAIITILFMILVGILLLVNPATFAIGIIKVAGVVLFLWGIYDLIRYFRTPADVAARGSAFFSGITMITLGAYCFFGSDWFVNVFPVLAVLYGLFQVLIGFRKLQRMVDALRLGRPLWWLRAISAGITLLFGFLIVFNPTMTLMSVWVFTGITLIIEGIFDVVLLYTTYKKRLAEDPLQRNDYAHIEV